MTNVASLMNLRQDIIRVYTQAHSKFGFFAAPKPGASTIVSCPILEI